MSRIAHAGITELHRTADSPSYELNRMQQKRTDFAFPPSLSPSKPALSLPNGPALRLPRTCRTGLSNGPAEWAGSGNNGVGGAW